MGMRLLLVTLAFIFLGASPAQAMLGSTVEVTGGSPEQRRAVHEVIASCAVSSAWVEERIGQVVVEIAEDIPGAHFRTAAIAMPGKIVMRSAFDNLRPGDQHVSYEWGEDCALFRDIFCHEFGHEVWYALTDEARERWNRSHFQLPGWTPPLEAFAENFRLTMYPPKMRLREITVSPYAMLGYDEFAAFIGLAGMGSSGSGVGGVYTGPTRSGIEPQRAATREVKGTIGWCTAWGS